MKGGRMTKAFARTAVNILLTTCVAEEKWLVFHTTTA